YLHDEISSDKRNPRVNANGLIYGSPEESTDEVPVLDPVHFKATTITEPYLDPKTPSTKNNPMGPSFFWGDDPIWDSHTSIHNPIMDEKGRVWFTAKLRPDENPSWCQAGSDLPSAKLTPMKASARQLSMYDPKTKTWSMINTCFSTHHLYFTKDGMLWTSAGGPQSGVVGWLDVKKYLATHDEKASQGWTAVVVDSNGNGQRDDEDKKVQAAFYAVQPSPVDDSIWGQSMDVGFSRMDQPGYIMRLVPGRNPPATTLTEIYLPPEGTFGPRGVDVDGHGVVWTGLASGQLASFDRSKCKGPLNGPEAATGKLCREGWTLYRMPGPQFAGMDPSGSANHAYYVWVDRFNTLGLGADVPIMMANGSESMLALVNGKFVDLHVPYPMGLFTKNADGRIDDPKAGWKGKGLWTTSGTRTVFHNEGGKEEQPIVYKFQVRPNPLAN
ncbi:MAG: carboxypeptidase regulatory-like domain-containing protein, partial [Alphaproteobacteria bacterium]|nr:carboxypeptidase regulatory-like domain-containing protein [Alphaproteobacteria bacterium]